MHDKLMQLIEWYRHALEGGGYPLIVLLMAIESSFVPLPSELVIPFAAHYAQTHGQMTVTGVVIAGAIGSWLGATAMYWGSRWAGRPLVLRYGKLFWIPPAKVELAERWSSEFGNFGVFASRFIPVVRHLIGIPAGIVRLNYLTYSLYTLVGSAAWCAVLAWVGLKAGQDEALMNGELHRIVIWLLGGLAVLGVIYYFLVHRIAQRSRAKQAGSGPGA
jgi:membrane protein DedA with SNARE-associated domain